MMTPGTFSARVFAHMSPPPSARDDFRCAHRSSRPVHETAIRRMPAVASPVKHFPALLRQARRRPRSGSTAVVRYCPTSSARVVVVASGPPNTPACPTRGVAHCLELGKEAIFGFRKIATTPMRPPGPMIRPRRGPQARLQFSRPGGPGGRVPTRALRATVGRRHPRKRPARPPPTTPAQPPAAARPPPHPGEPRGRRFSSPLRPCLDAHLRAGWKGPFTTAGGLSFPTRRRPCRDVRIVTGQPPLGPPSPPPQPPRRARPPPRPEVAWAGRVRRPNSHLSAPACRTSGPRHASRVCQIWSVSRM